MSLNFNGRTELKKNMNEFLPKINHTWNMLLPGQLFIKKNLFLVFVIARDPLEKCNSWKRNIEKKFL